SALLADPYPCAFLSWQYDAKYLGQRDVQEAMTSLAQKAREHPAKSCRGAAAGGETPPVTPPPPPPPLPVPPQAGFIAPDCTAGTVCQFSDGSTDADGTIASRTWNFGDQGTATDPNPAHTYASAGTYTITLSVTDDDGGTSTVSASLTVAAAPLPNQSPTAAFTAPSCTASLPCRFTDGSADSDGSIVSRSWIFGPGASSSETNPSSVFAAAGTYLVTLIVTDDQGASSSIAQNVVVAAAPLPVIKAPVLSLRLIAKAGREYVRLTWTGASGATVDLYKNERREKVVNDGVVTRAPISAGPTTYSYRICEAGSTNCSNTTTVTLSSPTISLQVTGSSGDRRQRATLAWANATGSKVDVYRNGTLLKTTRNDGQFFDSQERRGPATDSYKVCQAATATCSNAVTVIFR
ncbi:MAG: PKD domain-containing protein, partial [Gemmatimonadales bacterium]